MKKQRMKRLTSWLLTFVMIIGMLPAMTIHSHAYDCPECGETFDCEWDEQLEYHNDYHKWKCDNCGECYGEETKCDTEDHHACGGDEHYCAGGHCVSGLDDSYLNCPADEYGTGCGGIDENRCLWCHEETDMFCCQVCPYASDFESHLCPDHGVCPTECSGVGDDVHWDTSKYCCEDCGTCLVYAWEEASHTCEIHSCPCKCELCPDCGECTADKDGCPSCDNPCGCECELLRCGTCERCEFTDDYTETHCMSCYECFEDVDKCDDPDCDSHAQDICAECAACEYCDQCEMCVNNPDFDEWHCPDCDTCQISEYNICDEHEQCFCQCDFCDGCDEHLDDDDYSSGTHCEDCGACCESEGVDSVICDICGGCGFCNGCFEEGGSCEDCGMCEGTGGVGEEHCEDCGECFEGSAERSECTECGESLCADCVGDVCEECGLCYDNCAEECWSCGEPCNCICEQEDVCEDCGNCVNMMEECWVCGAPCACLCEETRCWECGLCETEAIKTYGMASCEECGMCACSCLCDPPVTVQAAMANREMMLLRVYVQDFYDYVDNAPISLIYEENGVEKLKSCGLTYSHDDNDPYLNVYIHKDDKDLFKGIRVGSTWSILPMEGEDYEIIGIYDDEEGEQIAYRAYPEEGKACKSIEWSYGPHTVTLQVSARAGYMGDYGLPGIGEMVDVVLWPAGIDAVYGSEGDTQKVWSEMTSDGRFDYGMINLDNRLKDAKIVISGKMSGYSRTFQGFNHVVSNWGVSSDKVRGLAVTLPEDQYTITVICEGYAPFTTKLYVYQQPDDVLPASSGKYLHMGELRSEDNKFRQMVEDYLETIPDYEGFRSEDFAELVDGLSPGWDKSETLQYIMLNTKTGKTDTLQVKVKTDGDPVEDEVIVSAKRLGSDDKTAYKLPVYEGSSVKFYALPKGNYVVTATDADGNAYTTVLYNQEKADKEAHPNDVAPVNTVEIEKVNSAGYAILSFVANDAPFTPECVLYTITDDEDNIWYVGGADRSKYYASREKWVDNPTQTEKLMLPDGRYTVEAVAVKQTKTINGVKPDLKAQIANGLHGTATFSVTGGLTYTTAVRLKPVEYGTLKAQFVSETVDGYTDPPVNMNNARITYTIYAESVDVVSANPDQFTPLKKVVSVPNGYSKTLVQLRDEDGMLLGEYEERGLRPGEVERPKTGNPRTMVDFGDVAPGDYTVMVKTTGARNSELNKVNYFAYVTVEDGKTSVANVVMTTGTGMTTFDQQFVVKSDKGTPIPGAMVTLVRNDKNGTPAIVEKYTTNSNGTVTATMTFANPGSVLDSDFNSEAFGYTVYVYADGYKYCDVNGNDVELTNTTVGGASVKGYRAKHWEASSQTTDSYLIWITNFKDVAARNKHLNLALSSNYYDLIDNNLIREMTSDVTGEEFRTLYAELVTERNALVNLTTTPVNLKMTSKAPSITDAYSVPSKEDQLNLYVQMLQRVELHCVASGENVRYQWQKYDSDNGWVDVPHGYPTSHDGILIIKEAKLSDEGMYQCRAYNDAGKTVSTNFRVNVTKAPLQGKPYINGDCNPGKTLTAVPNVDETVFTDPGYTYQWQKNSGSGWEDITGATDKTMTVSGDLTGSRVRVIIGSANYPDSRLTTKPMGPVVKAPNPNMLTSYPLWTDKTSTIKVGTASDNITVAGAEYVIVENGQQPDWSKAVKCAADGDKIEFTGLTQGKTYRVYGRYAANETYGPSEHVTYNFIVVGEYVKPTDVIFQGDTTEEITENGKTFEVPVIYVKNSGTSYLSYAVNPENYTDGAYYINFKGNGGETLATLHPEDGGNALKVQFNAAPGMTGDMKVAAYYSMSVSGGSTEISVHNQNPYGNYGNLYTNVILRFVADAEAKNDVYAIDLVESKEIFETQSWTVDPVTVKPAEAGVDANDLTWTTSDAKIATVDKGVVTGVKPGTATITATDPATGVSDSIVITVKSLDVEAESISVDESKLLGVNDTAQLTAVIDPGNAAGNVSWSSSDTSVATVSKEGLITAKKAGTATITAASGAITDTCAVTVHEHHADTLTYDTTGTTSGHWKVCEESGCGVTFAVADHAVTYANENDCTSVGSCACGYTVAAQSSHNFQYTYNPNQHWKVCKNSGCAVIDETTRADHDFNVPEATVDTAKVCDDCGYVAENALGVTVIENPVVTITEPQRGKTAPTTATANSECFTVEEVSWIPADSTFAASTVYSVRLRLVAGENCEFVGGAVKVNEYTISAADLLKNELKEVELIVTFPKTEARPSSGGGGGSVTPSKPTKPEEPEQTDVIDKPVFIDVPADSYYAAAVDWAVEKGITTGTSENTFSPNASCTRAQAVTFLWRAAGSPAPKSSKMPFGDVASGMYYHDAVLWAMENGITSGTSADTFSPNATCTRAQIVTFLFRAMKAAGVSGTNPFTDVMGNEYYADAVLWAVKNGVTAGTTANTFSPNNDCTRAQIVTFLFRALGDEE